MMLVHINQNSLPDIVNDCEEKLHSSINNDQMKIMCKQIAHSLRIVADQVDRKYCQDNDFNQNLHYLSIRLIFQSIFSSLCTQSLLSYLLLFCKTKTYLY